MRIVRNRRKQKYLRYDDKVSLGGNENFKRESLGSFNKILGGLNFVPLIENGCSQFSHLID